MTRSKTTIVFGSLFAGALMAAIPAIAAPDATVADMGDMTKALDYFHAHSFNFPQNFRFAHPGPEWFLQHKDDFKFSDKQSTELTKLSKEMMDDMKKYDVESIKAHEKYEKDGNGPSPSASLLKSDIDMIGKAEENLAYTMIPFHLTSHALLTSEQKKTFDDLVAKGEGKK